MAQKIFVAVENSSLFDIALNTYGSVDFIGKLIEDNPENGLNLYPDAGTQFVWDDSLQISQTNAIIGGSGMFVGQKYATRPLDKPQANYAPQNILPPTLAGAISVGSTINCLPGSWAGLPTPTTSFQWQTSTDGGVSWGDITGETGSSYVILPTDDGKLLRCNQIATNSLGTAQKASAFVAPYTSAATNVPPSNYTAPSIVVSGGGSPIVGAYLVASIGTWFGTSPITYSFVWKRGTTTVGTQIYYQIQSADYGQSIKCEVTATNAFGNSTVITSSVTGQSIPVNTVAPAVSGTPVVGSVLTTTNGTWTGNATITYAYQWLRNGSAITSATSSTYTLVSTDLGQVITCRVTATNPLGNASATSNSITATQTPVNTLTPSIYGNNTPTSTLAINVGDWDAYPAISGYTYQWQYSTNGTTWTNLTPGTNSTYTVVTADIGRLIRCQVTATNSVGNSTATTNSLLIDSVPINTVAPVISGTTLVGSILTTTDGTWTGSGTITFTYRWLRNGVVISGATASTYTTVSADAGCNIESEVTATNSIGPSVLTSNAIIPTIAPSLLSSPVIYGSYLSGSTLTVEKGDYSAYPAVTLTYQWQRSTNGGSTWSNISGQTGTSYVVQSGDVSNQIRVQEFATNGIGIGLTTNSNVASIIALVVQRPDNTVAPAVTGNPYIGQVLTSTTGTWSNTPTSYTYQWFREDKVAGTSASAISGATSSTYTLVTADTNCFITCRVTGTNAGGSELAVSNETYAYDADFYAVITYATAQSFTLPSVNQRQKFSRLVKELKDNSMWTINDRFFWMANDGSSDFGRINWMSPSTGTLLSLVSTPTWTSNVGFVSTGSSYIDTQYNPSTQGVNYTLNNAGRYCFITLRASASGQINIDGANTNTNTNVMYVATGQNNHHINQGSTTGSGINTSCDGYHCITRTGASLSQRSTDLSQSLNVASTSIFNGTQQIMRSAQIAAIAGNGYGFYAIGGAIANADIATHRAIIKKYMNNL